MYKHTKIIATISDKRCDVPFLEQLYEAGMNVVRLNSAHLDEEGFLNIINNVRAVSDQIAILVDTKGPEIRTTVLENPIELKIGDKIKIIGNPEGISSRETLYITYRNITDEMHVGDDILIDDGEVDLEVIEAEPAARGNTATGLTKHVVTDTGLKVQVPAFVNMGDVIRVDTRTGEYVTRV